jgi:hypothetical protein
VDLFSVILPLASMFIGATITYYVNIL